MPINLDQTPHPLIEDHYHIRDLIERQEARHKDREYHRGRVKLRDERETDIKDYREFMIMDFWCDQCKEDFKSQTVKQVETDWNNSEQQIAFYKSKCFKGHWCIRLITDRYKDGYYVRSKRIFQDRGNHFDDTVQPFETGYNMLYGKPK